MIQGKCGHFLKTLLSSPKFSVLKWKERTLWSLKCDESGAECAKPSKTLFNSRLELKFLDQYRSYNKSSSNATKSKKRRKGSDGLEVLSQKDCLARVQFASKFLALLDKEPEVLDKVIFSDEGNFRVARNAEAYVERFDESERLPTIVWCGMSSSQVIGPYFFNSFLTDRSYVRMLHNYFLPQIQKRGIPLDQIWFQQDGAPPHRTKFSLTFLKKTFDSRLMAIGTKDYVWPAKSQDLTPLDFFLWDHLKFNIKRNHSPSTSQETLRQNIMTEIERLNANPNILERVVYELRSRLEKCIEMNGERFKISKQNY